MTGPKWPSRLGEHRTFIYPKSLNNLKPKKILKGLVMGALGSHPDQVHTRTHLMVRYMCPLKYAIECYTYHVLSVLAPTRLCKPPLLPPRRACGMGLHPCIMSRNLTIMLYQTT